MKKLLTNKYALAAIIIGGALIAWYLYQRRWLRYGDFGRSDFAGRSSMAGKLGIRVYEQPAVKAGDSIEIVQDDPTAPPASVINGTHEVLEILTPDTSFHKDWWIITTTNDPGPGQRQPGKYRKA